MSDLANRRCAPADGGRSLDAGAARDLLARLEGWEMDAAAKEIRRSFEFGNFHETMAFVNAVAWVAHREDHHPDLEVGYGRCAVRFSTHSVGGLSENDFICAAKIDALARG
jgi:4a-hydroxytetrahydrobiopterin dehydratase